MIAETELPIAIEIMNPNVGDLIVEDANFGNYKLECLIRKGRFLKALPIKGLAHQVTWLVELANGKQASFDPSICKISERASEIALPFDYEISDKEKGNENYTPEYFLEPCRNFLGGFDLDPFSNEIAQQSIQASTFWTKDDDALSQDWIPYQKKWVNPPYSAKLIKLAIAKTLQYTDIGETLLLVNTSSSAKWFQSCMEKCSAYLHPSKRIPFYNPYREIEYRNKTKKRSGNEYDQTLFYFGSRPLAFAEALSILGKAVQPIRKSAIADIDSVAELQEGDRVMIDNDPQNTAVFYSVYCSMPDIACVVRHDDTTEDIELCRLSLVAAIAPEPKLSSANLRIDAPRSSVLVETIKSELPLERLADLLAERDRLIALGASPKGVWLEKSRPSKRNFDQVVWKADKPHEWLDGKKSRYIGEVDSKEHISAIAQHSAGQKLRKIEREIKSIEKKS